MCHTEITYCYNCPNHRERWIVCPLFASPGHGVSNQPVVVMPAHPCLCCWKGKFSLSHQNIGKSVHFSRSMKYLFGAKIIIQTTCSVFDVQSHSTIWGYAWRSWNSRVTSLWPTYCCPLRLNQTEFIVRLSFYLY